MKKRFAPATNVVFVLDNPEKFFMTCDGCKVMNMQRTAYVNMPSSVLNLFQMVSSSATVLMFNLNTYRMNMYVSDVYDNLCNNYYRLQKDNQLNISCFGNTQMQLTVLNE